MKSIDVKIVMTPEELIRRHEARNKRVLYKQGAYTRTAMQRSMRYTSKDDKHSAPGQPPLAHKNKRRGPLLRKLITFRVQLSNVGGENSVIAGPELIGSASDQTVPRTLDKGGRIKLRLLKAHEFEIGEYGPIRYLGNRKFARVLLETPGQAARATRLVAEENAIRQSAGAFIKPRPFTAPVLTDGGENLRKLIAREPL
jgi:hypothetical protein